MIRRRTPACTIHRSVMTRLLLFSSLLALGYKIHLYVSYWFAQTMSTVPFALDSYFQDFALPVCKFRLKSKPTMGKFRLKCTQTRCFYDLVFKKTRPSALGMSDPLMDQGGQVDKDDQSMTSITTEQVVSWVLRHIFLFSTRS